MRTLSFSMFTHSFWRFLFVYDELTCVVLKCVSYQDTVRLQGLVPLQVNHACVPLNPKVLWSTWLYERIMKAVHILILDTNVTYLTSHRSSCFTTKAQYGESYLPPWCRTPQCCFVVPHILC